MRERKAGGDDQKAKSRNRRSFQMLKIGETRLERNCRKSLKRKESKGDRVRTPNTSTTIQYQLNAKEVRIAYERSNCRSLTFEDQAYRFEGKKKEVEQNNAWKAKKKKKAIENKFNRYKKVSTHLSMKCNLVLNVPS